jgi:N-acyl-D-amino-acid deacylase
MLELRFINARIVDGSGNPWFHGDVGIADGRIATLGRSDAVAARRTIDVDGRVVTPGFIDLHSHADFTLPQHPRASASIRQGVTTQLLGNCGFSPFPVRGDRLGLLRDYSAFLDDGLAWGDWEGAAGYIAHLTEKGIAPNVALQVGHGTLRIAAMGFEPRAPKAEELADMQTLLAQALSEGALGMSTGLTYTPGSYSETDELVALAEVVARFGGFYSSHIRGEGYTLVEGVEEALDIGRRAGLPVQLSHHKAIGRGNWSKIETTLELLDTARDAGQDVLADQYPYTAGSTTLAVLLPRWAMERGIEGARALLEDASTYARIREQIERQDPEDLRRGQREFYPDDVVIADTPPPLQDYGGMSLREVARVRGEPPVDAALHLLRVGGGAVLTIVNGMSDENVDRIMAHPAVAVASDGWTLTTEAGGRPHPRNFGTFPRVLGRYVRDRPVLRLEDAVRKMTSLPAQRLGLHDRGLLRPGAAADLVVVDPDVVTDRATFDRPAYPDGISHVAVNGQLVIEDGDEVDDAPFTGRVLTRGAA